MIYLILVVLFGMTTPVWAETERYLSSDKVIYETPQEQDVLKVNTAFGFGTVLEFPDRPTMVTVGDNSLVQVEVPQNSKNVAIKPLEESGETNLFVFTANQRFNYKIIIGDEHKVDYVIDAQKAMASKAKDQKPLAIGELLKMAKNYSVLKQFGNINDREFIHKDLFYECHNPRLDVKVLEAFTYKSPHYLILHLKIRNATGDFHELNEQNTHVYIQGQKFAPQYIVFENPMLKPGFVSHAWLVLANSFISLDNKFTFGIGGPGNAEAICY